MAADWNGQTIGPDAAQSAQPKDGAMAGAVPKVGGESPYLAAAREASPLARSFFDAYKPEAAGAFGKADVPFSDDYFAQFHSEGLNAPTTWGVLDGETGKNALQQQYETVMKTAKEAAMSRVRGIAADPFKATEARFNERRRNFIENNPNAVSAKERSNYLGGSVAQTKQQTGAPAIGGTVAQQAGVAMRKSGNAQVPFYTYGSTRVDLPACIDVNDDAAVGKAMRDNNRIIDWMDNADNDEEEV